MDVQRRKKMSWNNFIWFIGGWAVAAIFYYVV